MGSFFKAKFHRAEPVARGCSIKNVFKISKRGRVSLFLRTLIKDYSSIGVFLSTLENFIGHIFCITHVGGCVWPWNFFWELFETFRIFLRAPIYCSHCDFGGILLSILILIHILTGKKYAKFIKKTILFKMFKFSLPPLFPLLRLLVASCVYKM